MIYIILLIGALSLTLLAIALFYLIFDAKNRARRRDFTEGEARQ
jgi:hypothetical protein